MSSEAELEVRPVRAGDAAALARCVERCYDTTYPGTAFYDPRRLRRMIERGEHGGVVALDDGVLVGHIAIRPAPRGSSVVEAGTTIVDPDHRGRGVMGMLAAELAGHCRRLGIVGFVHFPTTAHTVMQRASIAGGGRETGILLGYIPAHTADQTIERSSGGRLAVTVVYQPLSAARSQTLFVPARYERPITAMAAELDLVRRWARPIKRTKGPSALSRSADRARSLERISLNRIGADITDVADTLTALDRELLHVDLPMSDPAIEHATEALVAAGFVFGAWLPGWAGHDLLRLQRIRSPAPRTDQPNLFSDGAASIMRLIRVDAGAGAGKAVS